MKTGRKEVLDETVFCTTCFAMFVSKIRLYCCFLNVFFLFNSICFPHPKLNSHIFHPALEPYTYCDSQKADIFIL